ncbi:MNNG and nitrosoguanidine resistance protein [Diaporthe sp. PMI_573]|nr:MNNG and nitrosoguanidine resistance protein [Diaporthaceae sp. PMI_573]
MNSQDRKDGVDSGTGGDEHHGHENGLGRLKEQQPHHSVGFWHPHMSKVRRHVILLWFRTVLILLVAIFAILSLYWGVLFRVEANLRSIIVHVVDFDATIAPYDGVEPVVGPAVVELTQQLVESPTPSLGYTTVPASEYANDPLQVREAVYRWDAWAAVVINPNATFLLREAIETGNASYDPTEAVQIVIQTARDSTTMQSDILPYLLKFTKEFGAMFGPMWGQMIMSNESIPRENLARASAAVNPGVAPLFYDLRPFKPAPATPAVSIGLIYLIIMAFFSFSFFLPIHMKYIQPQGHPPLHFWQLIIWRWLATIAAYCLISLAYSIISLAFQIPFWPGPASHVYSPPPEGATAYGEATFVVYWLVNYVGMCALGLACENVAMLIGQPWTALWLIWVITNVCRSFYSLDLAPGFYRWGYAWPLHHVVEASRQMLFDLHSRVGLNVGVLFAWAAVNTVLFPFCCYFMRWKGEHEKRQAEKNKNRYVVNTEDGEKEVEKEKGQKPPIRKRGFMRGV